MVAVNLPAVILKGPVANNGTVSFAYPTGFTRSMFLGAAVGGQAVVNDNDLYSEDEREISIAYNASTIVVTNKTGLTWPTKAKVRVQASRSATPTSTLVSAGLLPENFGAVGGDPTHDDAPGIAAAANSADVLGGFVRLGDGPYYINSAMAFEFGPRLIGNGQTRFIQGSGVDVLTVAPAAKYVTGTNLLASDAEASDPDRTITLATGKGANFAVGTWAILKSDADAPGSQNVGSAHVATLAEYVFIEGISGDVITLATPLVFSYDTDDSAQLVNVNLISGTQISGIILDGYPDVYGTGIVLVNNLDAELTDLGFNRMRGPSIELQGCIQGRVSKIRARDHNSIGFTDVDGFGYVVVELGLNLGLMVSDLIVDRVRHAYTTGGSSSASILGDEVGIPMFSVISDSLAVSTRGAGWDTHEAGYGITFSNCHARGGRDRGHQSRSIATRFVNCSASDCFGSALSIEGHASDTVVTDYFAQRCAYGTNGGTSFAARGSVWDSGPRTRIRGCDIEDSGGMGIRKGDSAGNLDASATWENIRIRNCNRTGLSGSTVGAVAVVSAGLVGEIIIRGLTVEQPDFAVNYGIRNTIDDVTILLSNDFYSGSITDGQRSLRPTDTAVGGGNLGLHAIGGRTDFTLVSGTLGLTGEATTFINVRGEGEANDSLDTILGGDVGSVVHLTALQENITVIHDVAAINLIAGTDFVMSSSLNVLKLVRIDSGKWTQIA
jgi:hypothetical protein